MRKRHFYKNQAFKPHTRGDVGFKFSFAFQPIMDVRNRQIISYEALVSGPRGEPSAAVFTQVFTGCSACEAQCC